MSKDLYLEVRTLRGTSKTISCGDTARFKIFPKSYDEDFMEFPIEIMVDCDRKGNPILKVLRGKCTIVDHTSKNVNS